MYQALYRKYRPKTLNEVWGQDTIVKIINNSLQSDKISHAYLFAGPRGTGKTSIAKIFARMVNCEDLNNGIPCEKCVSCTQINNNDIIEIDAASNNGVDEIRELKNKINLVPSYGKYKIYIIDEVHMLTTGAFNALLKTLEEPPSHVIFVLATTDPHKIPETILSRCQRLDFKKISENNIVKRLKQIATTENIVINEDAMYEIARLSDGGMRDSIGMLDQAVAYADNKITVEDIHDINGTLTAKDLKELIELIINKKIEKILQKLDFYNDSGKNFVKLTEELIIFLRNILLCKEAPEYFKTISNEFELYNSLVKIIDTNTILNHIGHLNECTLEMKTTNNTKLLLEITIIKMLGQKEIIKTEEIQKTVEKESPKEDIEIKIELKNSEPVEKNTTKPPIKTEELGQKVEIVENIQNKPQEKTIDSETLTHIKEIRIDNTLSRFNKKAIKALTEKITSLNDFLLDPDISKYASIILDGTLKAASEENLIFVYKNERTANLFNQNLLNIEETLKKVTDNHYKVIATDINNWEKIKTEFNNKQKQYNYKEEDFNLEELFKEEKQNEFSVFEDLIEYQ